jgi:hypothetical protein
MRPILRKVGKARFLGPAVIVAVALILISNLAYAYTTSNLKVLQIQEDRFYNYDFLDEDAVDVFEDFEWGSDGTSLDVEPPHGVDWTVTIWIDWLGTASAEIDTEQHHQGTKSAKFYIDYGNSVFASYPDYRPSYRGFWLKTEGYAKPTTITGDGQHDIFVRVNGATLQYFYNWGWQSTSCSLSPNQWHKIEFKDIDWGSGKYSIYVDDNYVQRVDMCPDMGYNGITQYYSCEYTGSFWIDDILEYPPSSNGVACAATMVFYNNAWVNKVKNMYYGMADWATWDYAPLNNGNGWIWDGDRGTKTHYPFNNPVYLPEPIDAYVLMHLRVYAPNPPDYMENSAWGKYVIGTTHCDEFPEYPSVPWQTWHGYHEVAEEFFADWAIDDGYTVFEDWTSFYNEEDFRVDVQPDGYICIWENDGDATAVYVP